MNAQAKSFELQRSRLFSSWLQQSGVSLAFTTYTIGKLFMIGCKSDGHLSIWERSFPRPMGIARNGSGTVWLGTQQHLWRFENYMDGPDEKKDALFVPISSHLTGDVDVHDIQVAPDGSPYFVVTRFNCLATIDDRHSFVPIQLPPFIDRLAAED